MAAQWSTWLTGHACTERAHGVCAHMACARAWHVRARCVCARVACARAWRVRAHERGFACPCARSSVRMCMRVCMLEHDGVMDLCARARACVYACALNYLYFVS